MSKTNNPPREFVLSDETIKRFERMRDQGKLTKRDRYLWDKHKDYQKYLRRVKKGERP